MSAEYEGRLRDVEMTITRERLMTIPPGQPHVRVATAAESATYGAPVTICPPSRTRPNDPVQCETLIPPATGDTGQSALEDYTSRAASWTLTAHELRPGHALQFDATLAHGASATRRTVGVKLPNPEGWAVYAEYLIRPFMPPRARLISLQYQLLREARAFLDVDLQLHGLSLSAARDVLKSEVGVADGMAEQELERLSSRPGSGASYFFGFAEFLQLRRDTERALGSRFDQRAFHDFLVAQGRVSIRHLRRAVFGRFVKGGSPLRPS